MPTFLDPREAEFWVGAGLLIFLGIVLLMGAPRMIGQALDAKSAKIRADLEEAARLRAEAETLLAQLRAERADAERRSADMLAAAQAVKAAAVDLAARAAEAVLAARLAQGQPDPLVDRAVDQLAAKLS